MLKSFIRIGVWTLAIIFALAGPVAAQQPKKSVEAERAAEAANVLTEIMNIPESDIPEELMARAHGIAVIPHVVKGAFGIGGQWGKGLILNLPISPRSLMCVTLGLKEPSVVGVFSVFP